jgi:hypothetical protein
MLRRLRGEFESFMTVGTKSEVPKAREKATRKLSAILRSKKTAPARSWQAFLLSILGFWPIFVTKL